MMLRKKSEVPSRRIITFLQLGSFPGFYETTLAPGGKKFQRVRIATMAELKSSFVIAEQKMCHNIRDEVQGPSKNKHNAKFPRSFRKRSGKYAIK